MEEIFRGLLHYLSGYPGAFVMWIMGNRKRKIEDYFVVENYGGIAYFLGFAMFFVALLILGIMTH